MSNQKKYPKSTRRKQALHVVSRQYSTANLRMPNTYWDDSLPPALVSWGSQDDYEVIRQVGKGKYGEVYEGTNVRSKQKCVIKIMRPVKEHRLRREIKILRHVRGGPNIVELKEVLRDSDTKTPCFVFELVDAIGFRELQASVTDSDVRNYTYQLLQALDYCHSKGIMHRDVKPGNVLIDHKRKQLKLIDWGLADFYHPGKEYPVRVATRFYKGPELLVDIRDYDYSLDVWGVGCILAALLFKRPVFFRGEDEFDQLVKITRVLGSEGLHKYCEKYGVDLDPRLNQLIGVRPVVPWRKFTNADNQHLCNPEAFDLLSRLLVYDHHERLTCAEAMSHPYFDPVRPAQQAAAGTSAAEEAAPMDLATASTTSGSQAMAATDDLMAQLLAQVPLQQLGACPDGSAAAAAAAAAGPSCASGPSVGAFAALGMGSLGVGLAPMSLGSMGSLVGTSVGMIGPQAAVEEGVVEVASGSSRPAGASAAVAAAGGTDSDGECDGDVVTAAACAARALPSGASGKVRKAESRTRMSVALA